MQIDPLKSNKGSAYPYPILKVGGNFIERIRKINHKRPLHVW